LQASQSKLHLTFFDLVVNIILEYILKSVLYLPVVKVFPVSDDVFDLAHLEKILDLFLQQLLWHVDQDFEPGIVGGVIHLDDKAFEAG